MAAVIWALFLAFAWQGHVKRLVLYNILIIALYYGISMWGWQRSDLWIGILQLSWVVAFYLASFFALRKRVSNAGLKSIGAAFLATAAYFILLFLSAPFVDPYF